MDQSVVEVHKSKEALEFLDIIRFWPVLDVVHVPLVHLDTLLIDDIAKQLYGGGMELPTTSLA